MRNYIGNSHLDTPYMNCRDVLFLYTCLNDSNLRRVLCTVVELPRNIRITGHNQIIANDGDLNTGTRHEVFQDFISTISMQFCIEVVDIKVEKLSDELLLLYLLPVYNFVE